MTTRYHFVMPNDGQKNTVSKSFALNNDELSNRLTFIIGIHCYINFDSFQMQLKRTINKKRSNGIGRW